MSEIEMWSLERLGRAIAQGRPSEPRAARPVPARRPLRRTLGEVVWAVASRVARTGPLGAPAAGKH